MCNYYSLIKTCFFTLIIFGLGIANEPDNSVSKNIPIQNLTMILEEGIQKFSESLLVGEIAETDVSHIILAGPFNQTEMSEKEYETILLFTKGKGILKAGDQTFNIKPESIALPTTSQQLKITVTDNDTLHYIKIKKLLSPQDLIDLKSFPKANRSAVYFTNFDDCKAYTEKIKSPNTVSRTVLPKAYIPRVAMGTVQTIGPDAVGAHEHAMLDQLFLGLAGNDVTVHADDAQVDFKEYSILHIPIGSSHWVTVGEGKKMYYQWMDFFLTKQGEEWLKTHKHIKDYKKK